MRRTEGLKMDGFKVSVLFSQLMVVAAEIVLTSALIR